MVDDNGEMGVLFSSTLVCPFVVVNGANFLLETFVDSGWVVKGGKGRRTIV